MPYALWALIALVKILMNWCRHEDHFKKLSGIKAMRFQALFVKFSNLRALIFKLAFMSLSNPSQYFGLLHMVIADYTLELISKRLMVGYG